MPSKYILSQADFRSGDPQLARVADLLTEFGDRLISALDSQVLTLPESVNSSDLELTQEFNIKLDELNLDRSDSLKLERVLYSSGISAISLFESSNYQISTVIDQYYQLNEAGVWDTVKKIWSVLTEDGDPIAILSLILNLIAIVGDIPAVVGATAGISAGVSMVANGIDCLIQLARGRYFDALIDLAAILIPVFGEGFKTLRLSKYIKEMNQAAESAFRLGKIDQKTLTLLAKEEPKSLKLFSFFGQIGDFFVKIVKWLANFIGWILRTPPISFVPGIGKLGKSLVEFSEKSISPIIKATAAAGEEFKVLSKGTDVGKVIKDIETGAKTGIKTAAEPSAIYKLSADLTDAEKAVYTKIINKEALSVADQGIAKSLIADGKISLAPAIERIPPEVLEKGEKAVADFVNSKYDAFIKAAEDLKFNKLSAEELAAIKSSKEQVIAAALGREFAASLTKLDEIPVVVNQLATFAEGAGPGAWLSSELFSMVKNKPELLGKFCEELLNNPATRKQLLAQGEHVIGLYANIAKNPKVFEDFTRIALKSSENLEKITKSLTKLGKAAIASRRAARRLMIAKYLIGAPLRCPVRSYVDLAKGEQDVGGLEALIGGKKIAAKETASGLKYITSRSKFLLEQATETEDDVMRKQISGAAAVTLANVKKNSVGKGGPGRDAARLGPASFKDVCLSHVAQVIDQATDAITVVPSPEITDAKNATSAGIRAQEIQEITDKVVGGGSGISTAGTLTNVSANASAAEVAAARIREDVILSPDSEDPIYKYGLWYNLGRIMEGSLLIDDTIYAKLIKQLNQYSAIYPKVKKNAETTGTISLYPNPNEAAWIKLELDRCKENPSEYMPYFFGPGVTSQKIIDRY